MIALLYTASGLPPANLRVILREGVKAAGETADDSLLADEALKSAIPGFCAFLLRGIGYVGKFPTEQGLKLKTLKQPDWRDAFIAFVGMMGHTAEEFYRLTLAEYMLAVEGFCLLHGVDAASGMPATSQDVAAMLQRFPDRKTDEMRKI